jgi:hypothetical protein
MENIESFESFNEKNWIKDAIKEPGSLKRQLKKKKSDKITTSEINSELKKLVVKDKDSKKPGTQLDKRDAKKKKRLELAKTLGKMNESISDSDLKAKILYWLEYLDMFEYENNLLIHILDDIKEVYNKL